MQINEIFSNNGGDKILFTRENIYSEIKTALSSSALVFKKGESARIKSEVSDILVCMGWADSVKIHPTNLTVNFIKERVAFCLQLGNIARTYADLLKLQVISNKQIIDVGILAVPIRSDSIKLGSNAAQYERLKEEVILFENIITVPLVLIGLST